MLRAPPVPAWDCDGGKHCLHYSLPNAAMWKSAIKSIKPRMSSISLELAGWGLLQMCCRGGKHPSESARLRLCQSPHHSMLTYSPLLQGHEDLFFNTVLVDSSIGWELFGKECWFPPFQQSLLSSYPSLSYQRENLIQQGQMCPGSHSASPSSKGQPQSNNIKINNKNAVGCVLPTALHDNLK